MYKYVILVKFLYYILCRNFFLNPEVIFCNKTSAATKWKRRSM